MVSVCLPSDALLQHLPSHLGFLYFRRGLSLHGCSSKAQPLLLTLGDGYLLIATPPDLERGVAPLGPSTPAQPPPLGRGVSLHGCSRKHSRCSLAWTRGYLLKISIVFTNIPVINEQYVSCKALGNTCWHIASSLGLRVSWKWTDLCND